MNFNQNPRTAAVVAPAALAPAVTTSLVTPLAAAAIALSLLAGCASTPPATDARPRAVNIVGGDVTFPERERAWLEEGTFVNAHNLGKILPGLSKDQVHDLLGVPHFKEGIAGVRQWDYLFNFRTGPETYVTCAYQIHYDQDMQLHSSYWNSRECADLAVEKPVIVERTVEKIIEKPMAKKAQLSADALFAFGRSGATDITAQGRDELARLAAELRGLDDIETILVTGHTDRIGGDDANLRLSLARARTVRDVLVGHGVTARHIEVEGRGEREPVVDCAGESGRALVTCLAPNRRVEIEAVGRAPR